jgi:lysophospholipase L1-like esterase
MKTILCYGDSNTFGFNPEDYSRYDKNTRWTGVLQSNLGDKYKVINEGANNRNGFVTNPQGDLYSAQKHYPELISNSDNIDIIILAIGTNDLQFLYNANSDDFEHGLENLISISKNKTNDIILIPPVILSDNILNGFFKTQFDKTSILKSQTVGEIYYKLAKIHNCRIFDINKFTKPSETDGLHYSKESHKLIADNLTEFILSENF